MRVFGTELSSVILTLKIGFESFKVMSQKRQNKLKPKGMV